jgi:hypothetical protein
MEEAIPVRKWMGTAIAATEGVGGGCLAVAAMSDCGGCSRRRCALGLPCRGRLDLFIPRQIGTPGRGSGRFHPARRGGIGRGKVRGVAMFGVDEVNTGQAAGGGFRREERVRHVADMTRRRREEGLLSRLACFWILVQGLLGSPYSLVCCLLGQDEFRRK